MDIGSLTIARAAAAAGVGIETIRYYERRGLIDQPTQKRGAYRRYDERHVARIRFIKRAQELGFSLHDVGELLELRRNPARNRLAARAVAERKVEDIAARIRRLTAMQQALKQLVKACECSDRSHECPIIEALDDDSQPPDLERRPRTVTLGGSRVRI